MVSLVVVNIHETSDFETELKGIGKDVTVYSVSGASSMRSTPQTRMPSA